MTETGKVCLALSHARLEAPRGQGWDLSGASASPGKGQGPCSGQGQVPVAINEAGVNVVGALHTPDGLKTDPCALVGHDVDQAVLELVAGQVGADEAGCVGLGTGQQLARGRGWSGLASWGIVPGTQSRLWNQAGPALSPP